MNIRPIEKKDLPQAIEIWNEIVEVGQAFPQRDPLDLESGWDFFQAQSLTAVAIEEERIVGLYILHPNNVGRCGHICNASFAVDRNQRGKQIGEKLVRDCLEQAKALGFRILQFNAVVADNHAALALYRKLGFIPLGTIPGGFFSKEGIYKDIIPHYIEL